MVLECLPTGMFGSNTYIIGDHGIGVIIDAGVKGEEVSGVVKKHGLKIKYIILTHGHIDHICCAYDIKKKVNAKVLIHENDGELLTDPVMNGSAMFGEDSQFYPADALLKDGDVLEAGNLKLEVIHTPGHTPGCICIKTGNILFTGDTLFKLSIGRTDLPKGNYDDIISSIQKKLMPLDDETIVYPGHGELTTIEFEKQRNPFIL